MAAYNCVSTSSLLTLSTSWLRVESQRKRTTLLLAVVAQSGAINLQPVKSKSIILSLLTSQISTNKE
eukprot:scaffold1031_cov234-Chaetoceros_neogracile.AAC.2